MNPLLNLDDSTLWQRLAKGHEQAFDALFVRHHNAIYNYCYRRTANWSEAEDLMAAAFFELWRRRDRLTIRSDSALPLLYGISANLLRRRRRSLKAFERAVAKCGATIADEQRAQDVAAEQLAADDLAKKALEALSRLKPIDRDVLSLRLFGELSYAEIAEALDISPGTVGSRINRAVERLGNDPSLSLDATSLSHDVPQRKKNAPTGIDQVIAEQSQPPAQRPAIGDTHDT